MTDADLAAFLLRIALPTALLRVYVKRLTARGGDPDRVAVVAKELRRAERIRARLARHGWWN
jgi:hypothetical protein